MFPIFLGGVIEHGSDFSCGGGAIMISSDTSITIGKTETPPPPAPQVGEQQTFGLHHHIQYRVQICNVLIFNYRL